MAAFDPDAYLAKTAAFDPDAYLAKQPKSDGYDGARAIGRVVRDAMAGGVRGAGSIGATLMALPDAGARALGIQNDFIGRTDRRQSMDAALANLVGADTDSMAYGAGKLGAEIAGTSGIGGAIAKPAAAILGRVAPSIAPMVTSAIETSGMSAGGATGLPAWLARTAGGAITGGASAAAVNPSDAGPGAAIGAVAPSAFKVAGKAGELAGKGFNALTGGKVADEVVQLAKRAKELGIDIPADRIANSRPLNAVAAGLNYVPFSGRSATEDLMNSQLNRAVSRTFGQDSPNVTMALRRAGDQLGAQFDHTLRNNGVRFDQQLLEDLAAVHNKAESELSADLLKPVSNKIKDLIEKGADGVIDGQAAYNIKRELDRLGRGNTPTAYHALELKGVLMDALNRSLGQEKAAAFANVRKQYGNMLALEKLAANGAEGELSAARLGNLKNINNKDLQELADIAAQFVKAREGQHGAAQRAFAGVGALSLGGAPALAGAAAGGRVANSVLNSQALKNRLMGEAEPNRLIELLRSPDAQQLIYRTAPVTLTPAQ